MAVKLNKEQQEKLGQYAQDQMDMLKNKSTDQYSNKSKKLRAVLVSGAVAGFADEISTMWQMVGDYIKGVYNYIPIRTLAIIAGAAMWIAFDPTDVVPVVGRLDDIALIGFITTSFKDDILKYKVWKLNQLAEINVETDALDISSMEDVVVELNAEKGTAKIQMKDFTYDYFYVTRNGYEIFFALNQAVLYRKATAC